jgi:transposase
MGAGAIDCRTTNPDDLAKPGASLMFATSARASASRRRSRVSALAASNRPGARQRRGWKRLRTAEGAPLPPNTLAKLRRAMARLCLLAEQIRAIEAARGERLRQQPDEGAHPMVRRLAQIVGVAVETADRLVQEVLSRNRRDRRAVARSGGLTGTPDESGARRRRKGSGPSRERAGCAAACCNWPGAS